MKRLLHAVGLLTCCLGVSRAAAETPPTPEQISFFEKKIRPVLVAKCYACHAADAEKVRGDLLLDTRDGMRKGGKSEEPSVVPGNVEKSQIIKALRYKDPNMKMPPKEKLPDSVIADFEQWVKMGAPDPRVGGATKIAKHEIDIEKGRKYWAFQPPHKPEVPRVAGNWARTDVDRFLLAGMEAKGLKPVGDADRRTLIRRVYIDLIGLPPTPSEVDAFLAEAATHPEMAYEKVVDKLLASPRFGERWGRHWLDVARYAESSGKSTNIAYPHAWRYRDYVVEAFNKDKPYDQFIREQLAGDLIPAKDDRAKAEHLIATGFLAIGPKQHNERLPLQFQMDLVDEQIEATSVAFLGLTVHCARCHDHKFDPIPQKDYYALAGIFRSTETCYGTIRIIQSNHPSPLITLPKGSEATVGISPLSETRRELIEKQIKDVREQISKLTGADAMLRSLFLRTRVQILQSQLNLYESDGTPKLLAMGARDRNFPADSKLYNRGELDQPGETVKRGFPQVLTTKQPSLGRDGSGRLELARWIASAENPLTARVMVNRIWLHLFGRGIVPTPDNFGASGNRPDNQALLDYLAVSFVDNGWSVKKTVKMLVLSRAYQQSSQFVAKNYEADPDNVLVWRMPRRRLEAEALRDSILAVSGKLDTVPPRSSPLAGNGDGNVAFTFRMRPIDGFATESYRSVYLPIVRDQLPEALTLFDYPDPSLISGARATTTVPAQSLYLMNNPFVIRAADAVAEKLLTAGASDADRIKRAYQLYFSRLPSDKEQSTALAFLNRYVDTMSGKSPEQARQAAWAALCQGLFASAEFSHR